MPKYIPSLTATYNIVSMPTIREFNIFFSHAKKIYPRIRNRFSFFLSVNQHTLLFIEKCMYTFIEKCNA